MMAWIWKIGLWCCLLPCCLLAQDQASADGLCFEHAFFTRGTSAFDKGQYAKAERWMDKLIDQHPTCHHAYYWKGKCAEHFEDYAGAYEAYSIACTLSNEASYFIARGDLLRTVGTLRLQAPSTCGDCGKQLLPDISNTQPPLVYFKRAAIDYEQALRLAPQHKTAQSALQQTIQFIKRQP